MSEAPTEASSSSAKPPSGRHAVIILHGIGTPQRAMEPGEDAFWLSEEQFLKTLDHIVEMGADGPQITFDDGNASDVQIALPELEKRNLKATFFLLAGRLDTPGSLTRADVKALAQAGHEIGLHGYAHVDWRQLNANGRTREFETARDTLAALAGRPVTAAAAPFGLYNKTTLRDMAALGFSAFYTSDRGLSSASEFIRPRNCLERSMTETALKQALSGFVPMGRRPRRLLGIARKRYWPAKARS